MAYRFCAALSGLVSGNQQHLSALAQNRRTKLDVLGILGTAIGLSMDAFSVAVAVGTTLTAPTMRHYFRISFHFGLFQFLMPLGGYFIGVSIEPYIRNVDHWIAMALLTFVGANIIRESYAEQRDLDSYDPSSGAVLVILSIATSIDALIVGLGLGLLKGPILPASVIIGVVCALYSLLGISLGKRVGIALGRKFGRLGGAALILIGATILLEHLQLVPLVFQY